MTAFRRTVAALTGVAEDRLERLSGGDLSEVLLVRRPGGHLSVAKGGPACLTEAAMLRSLLGAGVPAPQVEAEHPNAILLEYVANDGVFSPAAWRDIGHRLRQLHERSAAAYGWAVDYRIGTVELDNRESTDWRQFWVGQRLVPTASLLDRPWRERIDRLAPRVADLLPERPRPAHLHGDLWQGNMLVSGGRLAAIIDPACYYGDAEVDLAMLTLFGAPPEEFWASYGALAAGWPARRVAYQIFPALVHLRLFGSAYGSIVERLCTEIERARAECD